MKESIYKSYEELPLFLNTADVYAGGTMIATGLEFRVEKEGFKSNDIL